MNATATHVMSNVMSSDPPTLTELLRRVAARDAGAFASLHRATHDCLLNVAMFTLRDRAQAEDALQEAFIRIWHHATSFDESRSTPMTWLMAVVRNRAIDLVRSQSMERSLVGELDEEALDVPNHREAEPAQRVERRDASRALTTHLARMRGSQRQALSMAYSLDMPHTEIAASLGAPLGTVKAWIRRGAQQLRTQLVVAGFGPL